MRQHTTLLATAGALLFAASTAHAQGVGPAPRPGMAVGQTFGISCPPVTLAMCSDPEFLYESNCGAQQRDRADSPCAVLLRGGMGNAAQTDREELAVVPRNLADSGIDYVVRDRTESPGRQYVPDLLSTHSRQAAVSYVASDIFTTDQIAEWRGNGAVVNSCQEYVWERYADINEFLHASRFARDDYRAVYNVAFGPASHPASIGTRHLNDSRLRGRDGRVFATLYPGHRVFRNRFHRMKAFPGYSSEFPVPENVPNLLESIASRSAEGRLFINRLQQARDNNLTHIRETWAWHKSMSDRFVRIPTPGLLGPMVLAGNPPPRGNVGLGVLGTTDVPGQRRYLDEELNELWRLQQRFDELENDWKRANGRFGESGWTVESAGLAPPAAQPPRPPMMGFNLRAPVRQGRPAGPVLGPMNIAFQNPETVVRKRILDEMIEVLRVANQYGCLSGADSPCDWSTLRFASVLQHTYGGFQDRDLERCNAFTAGNLQNVLNLDVVFVDDPDYPQFNCSVSTGSTITALQFEQLEADVDYCRQMQIALAEQRAADEARARVRAIPELIDPATGDFVVPGIQRSRDELMGNEYFGLGYNYRLGFEAGVNAELCQIDVHAVARAKAFARVFGKELVLLDVAADADTVERTVDIYARVANRNVFTPQDLFDPIDISVPQIEPLEFNLTWTGDFSRNQTIISFKIVVVVVPLSVSAGIAGKVGAELGLSVYADPADNDGCPSVEVGGLVRPFLGIDGYLEAAIDILIAKFGIRGTLNIITVSLPFRPSIRVIVNALSLDPADYELGVRARMDLELSTLSGVLSVFAKIGFCPFCYTGSRDIVRWTGPQWNTRLFDQEYKVTLADLFVALGG